MHFRTLKSNRVFLRGLRPEDENEIFQLRSDPRGNQFIDRPVTTSIEQAREFINKICAGLDNGDTYYWGITLAGDSAIVGVIALFDFSSDGKKADIGYELLYAYQGKGIMREAMTLVLDFAFTVLHLTQIDASVHIENERSLNVLKYHGFKTDGYRKGNFITLPLVKDERVG